MCGQDRSLVGSGGFRQGWERVEARASRGWPPPDPTGSNCALGSPSLQPAQLQSPEDQLPERTTGLAWKQKHAKAWVHQKWQKGLRGGGHWHFLLPTLLQKWFWSCFALIVRMNSGPRQGTETAKQVCFHRAEDHLYPALPLRAREPGKVDTLPCPPERPLQLQRGEATCELFKPQARKPPGGLLLQGRREGRDPGDYRLARSL